MELTPENKAHIDGMTYEQLLRKWRFAPSGDPWFQGPTGVYWGDRMAAIRSQCNAEHVRASKAIGWEGP